jgi:hypothetical protein
MHVPINVKSLNNFSKWQMGFNSAFKGLMCVGLKTLEPSCPLQACTGVTLPLQRHRREQHV